MYYLSLIRFISIFLITSNGNCVHQIFGYLYYRPCAAWRPSAEYNKGDFIFTSGKNETKSELHTFTYYKMSNNMASIIKTVL